MKRHLSFMVFFCFFLLGGMTILAFAEKGISSSDKKFVKEAANGGMVEVQAGELAQSKAQSPEVKEFAAQMVTDHSKANDELKRLAQQKNVSLPDKLEKKDKSMLDNLGTLSGANFDKQYMRQMVMDHVVDVSVFQAATQKGNDPDLKKWAVATLPTLEKHLVHARAVAKKAGVDVNQADKEGKKEADKRQKHL